MLFALGSSRIFGQGWGIVGYPQWFSQKHCAYLENLHALILFLPNIDGPIGVARGEVFAVGAERHLPHARVGPKSFKVLAGGGVPKPDGVIGAARDHKFSVRAVDRGHDGAHVAREGAEGLARGNIPNDCRPVGAGGSQALAIRAEGDAPNAAGLPGEAPDFFPPLAIPQRHGWAQVPGSDDLRVRTDGHTDGFGLALEVAYLISPRKFHHPHLAVPIAGDQQLAIAAECEALHFPMVRYERSNLLARHGVEQFHFRRVDLGFDESLANDNPLAVRTEGNAGNR